ncbi:helicase-related protein [Rickettsiales bacterium]|nr:helicase-related protein [Rickettsiales bacterium]
MFEKISAILGPTNTGKTFFAVEKMLSYKNGVIGFPLRLLARENYELVAQKIGKNKVALITGEEKIIPKDAEYFFCTVEAMPEKQQFEFLAIDEVQLAANFERGYQFTDKIINSRGSLETLLLGSLSIESLLKKIFPKLKVIKKSRLSNLKYYGYKNLTRLPPRSAIIAFSQIDVYSIAEKIKKFKGGVSVITGALSPDARNAQVKLFEKGHVDYIVATDAIGLGLNLAIKYIFFTTLIKFDGFKRRYLTNDEISQIAGRAGRYVNDGFFGVTQNLKELDNDLIKFVEEHRYSVIDRIFWRNSNLNFSSSKTLIESLKKKPKSSYFIYKKNANDLNQLNLLLQDKRIKKQVTNKVHLKALWEICGIPDYMKTMDEYHTRFLIKIANFLLIEKSCIPEPWIDMQVKQIQKVQDKISVINMKISQIRTWSYISFKKSWIENSQQYQIKIKKIENFLSNKLHENLVNKFVDETIKNPNQTLFENDQNFVYLNKMNDLFFSKKKIGFVKGFKFFFVNKKLEIKKKSFSYKYIKNSLAKVTGEIIKGFLSSDISSLNFSIEGEVFWKHERIACFQKGDDILSPKIKILSDNYFSSKDNLMIKKKVQNYLDIIIKRKIRIIKDIFDDSFKKDYSSSYRAICFGLYENMGHCLKKNYEYYYKNLNKDEIFLLKDYGITNGNNFLFLKNENLALLNIKQMLINIFYNLRIKKKIERKLISINKIKLAGNIPINLYNKIGYYEIDVNNDSYLIYYNFYEKLIDSIYFSKKKKISYSKKILEECSNEEDFLKNCFKNPRLLDLKPSIM